MGVCNRVGWLHPVLATSITGISPPRHQPTGNSTLRPKPGSHPYCVRKISLGINCQAVGKLPERHPFPHPTKSNLATAVAKAVGIVLSSNSTWWGPWDAWGLLFPKAPESLLKTREPQDSTDPRGPSVQDAVPGAFRGPGV